MAQNYYKTSLEVASDFGKTHKAIMDKIDGIVREFTIPPVEYFEETTLTNDRNRKHRGYGLTRDGYTLVAMGLTGTDALVFRVKYIAKFNMLSKEA